MKFYVLHHTPAKERKEKLLRDFEHHKMDVIWIEDFQPESMAYIYLREVYPPSDKKSHLQRNEHVSLTDAELSLYYKHLKVHVFPVGEDDPRVVVLEDDIIIPEGWDMLSYFKEVFDEFDEIEGDFLNIGTAFDMHPSSIRSDMLVYHEPHFTTRCAHAYAIAPKARSIFAEELKIVDDAVDWKFNDIIKKHGLKSCYVHPGLEQGSLEGSTKSLLR